MSYKSDARTRIKSGHENSSGKISLAAQKQLAAQYAPDAEMEARLALKRDQPRVYADFPPHVHAAVEAYHQKKTAFEVEEAAKNGGAQ